MADSFRAGVIGYGLAGSVFHAPLIEATDGLNLAAIVTSEQTNVLTVPLQSVVLRSAPGGDRPGVFLLTAGQARFTPVTSGVIGGLDIEVSGVAEGARIIVGPYQALRDMKDGTLVKVAAAAR